MKTNTARKPRATERTHEGAPAARLNAEQQLRRSVLSCLLWEREFYENGETIADRIRGLVKQVPATVVSNLAVEARSKLHLRHVPLYLTALLAGEARGSSLVSDTILDVVQRADELGEFLAIYARVNGVAPSQVKPKLSNQVRKGLAAAFHKFNAYGLAKYDRQDAEVRLRDALFLCHAKPRNAEQAEIWGQLISGTLPSPDTWEVELSAGKDKKATWTRLLSEGKLGYLALLRNLRNMEQAGVDRALVNAAIAARRGAERVLPFRYVAAARAAPSFEPALDTALVNACETLPRLTGKTVIVVDVSGSMRARLSAKSDMTRLDAGAALSAIMREMCEEPRVWATGGNDSTRVHKTVLVPARRGMAMIDVISEQMNRLGGGGIFLTPALGFIRDNEETADRVVVITDEQDCATDPSQSPLKAVPFGRDNYLINVASAKNGVGYGPLWTHLDGFSESVLRWIVEHEAAV